MDSSPRLPQRKIVWKNILYFGITTILGVVGLPLYAYFHGLHWVDWTVFALMGGATMMATTFGYHRLFAHRAFKTNRFVVFLNLFFGAGAFEGTALNWASQHRDHHRFTDTERDPYNIRQGFWHAHMGWFLFWRQPHNYENARDLSQDPMIKHQHDYWLLWAIAAGFVFPLLIGLALGRFWGVFWLGVCGRFVLVHHSVFLINSACHMFGVKIYDDTQTARDSWVCALLTNGEGYHNYHHTFPTDYRNGIRWFHWDPTKWMIKTLSFFGLTWDLKKTPEYLIYRARVNQEKKDLGAWLTDQAPERLRLILDSVAASHERLQHQLKNWERAYLEYRRQLQVNPMEQLNEVARRLQSTRTEFIRAYQHWQRILEQPQVLLAQTA